MANQDEISGLIESWMQGQQKIWNDWMGVVGKGIAPGEVTRTWQQGLERWRESMDGTLDAQAQAMKSWMEQAGKGGSTDSAWAAEGTRMVEQWTQAQRGLWDQWFAMMNKVAEGGATRPGTAQLEQYFAGWEQVSAQMRTLQEQWAASVAGGTAKGGRAKK